MGFCSEKTHLSAIYCFSVPAWITMHDASPFPPIVLKVGKKITRIAAQPSSAFVSFDGFCADVIVFWLISGLKLKMTTIKHVWKTPIHRWRQGKNAWNERNQHLSSYCCVDRLEAGLKTEHWPHGGDKRWFDFSFSRTPQCDLRLPCIEWIYFLFFCFVAFFSMELDVLTIFFFLVSIFIGYFGLLLDEYVIHSTWINKYQVSVFFVCLITYQTVCSPLSGWQEADFQLGD